MKHESITISQEVVYTTEELIELKRAVELRGGRIKDTHVIRNGQGISCIVEVPGERRSIN